MRVLLASLAFVLACGPKVAPKGTAFDEDEGRDEAHGSNVRRRAPDATSPCDSRRE